MKNLPPAASGSDRSCGPGSGAVREQVSSLGTKPETKTARRQSAGRSLHFRVRLGRLQSVRLQIERLVAAVLVLGEKLRDLRMAQRLAGLVRQQVLLRDVGDVFGLRVFREQVIVGLVLVRADVLGDREPPLFGVVELRARRRRSRRGTDRIGGGPLAPPRTWPGLFPCSPSHGRHPVYARADPSVAPSPFQGSRRGVSIRQDKLRLRTAAFLPHFSAARAGRPPPARGPLQPPAGRGRR